MFLSIPKVRRRNQIFTQGLLQDDCLVAVAYLQFCEKIVRMVP